MGSGSIQMQDHYIQGHGLIEPRQRTMKKVEGNWMKTELKKDAQHSYLYVGYDDKGS